MRQVPPHPGEVGVDVTVALIYGHIQIPPPLKYVGSGSKKGEKKRKGLNERKCWVIISETGMY